MKTSMHKILILTSIICTSLLFSINGFSQDSKQERKLPDGTIVYPDGTRRLPNGTIIFKGGTVEKKGTKVPLPDG